MELGGGGFHRGQPSGAAFPCHTVNVSALSTDLSP